MKIGDTQVYNGTATTMYFLDRQGNRVSGYVNSDCVFIEVIDPDQNEDSTAASGWMPTGTAGRTSRSARWR